jgi:hypothetical protein
VGVELVGPRRICDEPALLKVDQPWGSHRDGPVASIIARPRSAPSGGRPTGIMGPAWHPIRSVRGRGGVARSWAADGGCGGS